MRTQTKLEIAEYITSSRFWDGDETPEQLARKYSKSDLKDFAWEIFCEEDEAYNFDDMGAY